MIKYLKEAEIIPNLISIEHFEDVMLKIIPSFNNRYYQFYHGNKCRWIYENCLDKDIDPKPEQDPQISFHEFQLLLCRIAVDYMQKEQKDQIDKKHGYENPINNFFTDYLFLRTNQQIKDKHPIVDLNKPFLKYYKSLIKDNLLITEDIQRKKKNKESIENKADNIQEEQIKMQKEYEQIKQKLLSQQQVVDFLEVYKYLDKYLPQFPNELEIVRENMNLSERKPVVIGVQLPKPAADKGQKQNKPAKKSGNNKDQIDFKKIQWEGIPKDYPKTSLDYQVEHQNNILFQNPLISDFQRASLSQVEVGPCLIKEVLYPFQLSEQVRPYIESAIIAHNQLNYLFALENYAQARKEWLKELKEIGRNELPEHIQIYFEFVEAQVFDSIGKDEIAFSKYYNCMNLNKVLSDSNADKALSFCGMGCSLFNMEEYELALRCFLQAKEIRESIIGDDSIDTASVYNNIACCFMSLSRNREALAYFKLAAAIFQKELGPYHFRTLTTNRNINKCNKMAIEYMPEFSNGWISYVDDNFTKVKKKKKGKKK